MTRRTLAGAVLGLALLGAAPGRSEGMVTDVNIVTGVDVSDSVTPADMRAQVAALAAALSAPDFLAAVRRGRNGKVGVAVFAWYHHQYEILPWMEIGSPAEADAAARIIRSRVPVDLDREARKASAHFIGRLTDVSRAMDHARALVEETGTSGRAVVNIIGNGTDNMGEPASAARARLLDAGATVNGVVFGGAPAVAEYYRQEVAGGAGAFVIAADGADLSEVMRRKLLLDLVAALGTSD
jgi:hypothetical protein